MRDAFFLVGIDFIRQDGTIGICHTIAAIDQKKVDNGKAVSYNNSRKAVS